VGASLIMKKLVNLIFLGLTVIAACRDTAPTPEPTGIERRIDENAVAEFSGHRVGAFNLGTGVSLRSDGTIVAGNTAWLGVFDGKNAENFEVGIGSRVKIGRDVYECVGIRLDTSRDPEIKGGNGEVVLRLVPHHVGALVQPHKP
jgi:hypothetical protein